MTTWIVTTGNSDVILKNNKNWGNFYEEVRYDLECTEFQPLPLDPKDKSAGHTLPARVLGLVYANQSDYYESDLEFPLLDTYRQYIVEENVKPERIIILLTDQTQIFKQDQIIYEKCPYWQDTCTLKPLLGWYFKHNFDCQLEFLYLSPTETNKGIDNWNETLSLVQKTLGKLDFNPIKTVYVSHQAGTPAISSAVQFVSLGKFKTVKFLVSNEYFDENYDHQSKAESIESSNYWRGLQIQKAQQLLKKGLPAAAKEILIGLVPEQTIKEINQIVDFFNINNSLVKGQEFEVKSTVDRIVTALDLIEIFFKQENYIQGVAILNATQETFLKVAIISQTKKVNDLLIPLSSIVAWEKNGLFIKSQNEIKNSLNGQNPLDILSKLKFPKPEPHDFDFYYWDKYQNQRDRNFKLNNSRQFQWLCELKQDFKTWELLKWSCEYERKHEDDLRNQLLHNLLGVKSKEVCDYLLGYNKDAIKMFSDNAVDEVYYQSVKQPFLKALKFFGLCKEVEFNNKLESKLKKIADALN